MNYMFTAVKCEDCGYEFSTSDVDKAKCPKCGSKWVLIDQERDDAYTERLATGHDTC